MARAISVTELITKQRKIMQFEGEWKRVLGCPELRGCWLIYGDSGNGKTSFALQLCKYLSQFERVVYDSLEEGDSETMRMAFIQAGMEEVKNKIVLLDCESIEDLIERLSKHKSQNIIVIDSLQYTGITYTQYKALKKLFPNKLFIWISHMEGREPEGKTGRRIKYDCSIKIRVEGYRAFVTSRYGSKGFYTIWEDGANEYWGLSND